MALCVLILFNSCSYLPSDQFARHPSSLDWNLKPNEVLLKDWIDSNGAKRILYHVHLDKKSRILRFATIFSDGKINDEILENEGYTNVAGKNYYTRPWRSEYQNEPHNYLYKRSLENGQIFRKLILSDFNWPDSVDWEALPLYNVDSRRLIMNLKAHDGISFYSLYALPPNYDPNHKYKVVILILGETSIHTPEVEENNYMEDQTPNYLLSNNQIVLFANVRGKKYLGNTFRNTGIGQMHNHSLKDIITALNELSKKVNFDKKALRVIGHSRGGHIAALLATRLGEISKDYQIEKTIVSSGILNTVDGYYNFFKPMTSYNQQEGLDLDFRDDDWTGGALCYRLKDKFTDKQWEKIKKVERKHFEEHLLLFYPPGRKFCNTQAYFEQSPYHHIDKIQGEMVIIAGEDEEGICNPLGAYQFQEKAEKDLVKVITHPYGHGFDGGDSKQMEFWYRVIKDFFKIEQ
ncbi:MAG: hypothetical protein A2417_10315 [Bdellovibrionales bacterium RIFOXYC1_FULL_37_79]|nr:MAG: hypothetical protein A2417_10315 [Bdellovibrionales bacterium RIFOXYC1_FULL_37_79]